MDDNNSILLFMQPFSILTASPVDIDMIFFCYIYVYILNIYTYMLIYIKYIHIYYIHIYIK